MRRSWWIVSETLILTYKRLLEWEIGIMEDKEKLKRWRLILGQDSEERFAGMGAEGLDEEQQIMIWRWQPYITGRSREAS